MLSVVPSLMIDNSKEILFHGYFNYTLFYFKIAPTNIRLG